MGFLEDSDKEGFFLYELINIDEHIKQRSVFERLFYLTSRASHLIYNFFIEGRV